MRIPDPFLDHISSKAFFRAPGVNRAPGRFYAKLSLNPVKLFAIAQFDEKTERLFWQERYVVLQTPLKSALALGAGAFLAYILLDVYTGNIAPAAALLRMPIVLVLFGLFLYLHVNPKAVGHINTIAKLSVGVARRYLIGRVRSFVNIPNRFCFRACLNASALRAICLLCWKPFLLPQS